MTIASPNAKVGEKHKILIVDDDPLALELLQFTLDQFGYSVETASDGQSALERMRWFSPRFIISDIEMPGMSGIELCKTIRQRPSTQYTYFILLTSNSDPESVLTGLDAGADDYLSKPFRHEELRLRLEGGKRLLMLEGRAMMIFSLAKLAESRDQETGKHLERMREYSRAIAAELMQWPKFEKIIDAQFIELIYLTSPLHDVGKVGIPDAVLLKPGKLTPEEFEIMKRHTLIGGETLLASAEAHPEASFLKMALDIALKHHEKWDGSGYPFGLKGEAIPLPARIVALADVYDALTTKRVYKPAFSHDVATDIIRQSSGKHFDPELVDAFFNIENQIREIHAELEENSCLPTPVSVETTSFPSMTVA